MKLLENETQSRVNPSHFFDVKRVTSEIVEKALKVQMLYTHICQQLSSLLYSSNPSTKRFQVNSVSGIHRVDICEDMNLRLFRSRLATWIAVPSVDLGKMWLMSWI